MDRHTILSRITKIENELPKLMNTLYAMKSTNTATYRQNYEELSLDAAIRAERIACSLRNLIYAVNLVPKPVLMKKTAEIHGITITHAIDMVKITLPGLMPKRTKKVNTTFLTDPLHASLEAYVKEHTLPHFKECVICFSHMFDQTLPLKRVTDYDNLEYKQILDTVSAFLMTDDSGLFCDAYHTTEFADKDCTVLTLMEKTSFPAWLKSKESRVKTISDF